MRGIQRIALALVIIGAINWGLIGVFKFDLVASIFGGQGAFLSRVIYVLVALSGLACLGILISPVDDVVEDAEHHRRSFRKLDYETEFGDEPDFSKISETTEKTVVEKKTVGNKNQYSKKNNNKKK